jgi:hypothetical protein
VDVSLTLCQKALFQTALAEVLRRDHGGDGTKIITVIEISAVVEPCWAALGKLEDLSFAADLVWEGAELKDDTKPHGVADFWLRLMIKITINSNSLVKMHDRGADTTHKQ